MRSLKLEISSAGKMPVSEEIVAKKATTVMPENPKQTDFQLVRIKSTWCQIKKGEAICNSEDKITISQAKM